MSSNEIETNDVNGSRLAEQGPSSGRCSRQGNIGRHHANPVISKRRKWTSQENKIVMECYLLSEPKIGGYRKHMLSLWLQKGMFWVPEQRLVDQANTIRRNSWMTELQIEELERKITGSDSVILEEVRSVEALPDHVGEDLRNVLPEMGAEVQVGSLDEEEVAIVMELLSYVSSRRFVNPIHPNYSHPHTLIRKWHFLVAKANLVNVISGIFLQPTTVPYTKNIVFVKIFCRNKC